VNGNGVDESIVLPDGRVVEYWEGGDPAGRLVIMHPGSPETRVMGRWGHAAALDARVRLVSVSRPGYGGSTPTTEIGLLQTGRDTAVLASRLGADDYGVLGLSGGGPFATATAVADPGHVRALGIVGGTGPWRILRDASYLPEDRECLARLDAGDVTGAWEWMRQDSEKAFANLVGLEGDALVDAFMTDVGDDGRVVHERNYRALWADNLNEVLKGLDGFVFDNLAWGAEWDVDPRAVAAPAMLWYGDADTHCPPSHGRWFADRIPEAQLVVWTGETHVDVCDAHWPEVLEGLTRIWA